MSDESDINVFKALNFIRDSAPAYARAKAERIYLEEYRKSLKALLMQEAQSKGQTTTAGQEREAYAHDDYLAHLEGLKAAVEAEEALRWRLVGAQAKVEVWRSIGANQRAETKTL